MSARSGWFFSRNFIEHSKLTWFIKTTISAEKFLCAVLLVHVLYGQETDGDAMETSTRKTNYSHMVVRKVVRNKGPKNADVQVIPS